jgi:hypothetical protein
MSAHSAEDSANYILTIFIRLRCMQNQTVLMHNLILPFQQDGWTADDLEAGLPCAIDKGWIEMGKENKFVKITDAGYTLAKTFTVPLE